MVWETNQQYSHGFVVPFLMIYLIIKIPTSHFDTEKECKLPFQGKATLLIGIPLILTIFPIWVIRGANPDWRLLNLVLFAVILLISSSWIYDKGGLKLLKLLAFPLLFFIVAIPWPLATDLQLTQWLQQKVSETIVDLLLLLEHSATLEGTIIDVGVFGQIGVDQACSGINGLQASMVVSLFLGAYFGLPILQRITLYISGLIIAVIMNLIRAFSMSFVKVKGRGELLDSPVFSLGNWDAPNLHDLAGWIETLGILIMIIFIAKIFCIGALHQPLANMLSSWKNLRFNPPVGFSLTSILICSSSVVLGELHFRQNETQLSDMPRIKLTISDNEIIRKDLDIPRQVAAQLHFEEAFSIQWQDRFRSIPHPYGLEPIINPNEQYWQAFEANWDSGGACTAVLSTHSPDSCIPLTGLTQISPRVGELPNLIHVKIEGQKVLFEVYEFSRNYRKLFVFRCFWPHKLALGQPNLFPRGGYSLKGRIKSAIEGRRNVGGTMLALALANVDSSQTAIAKLQALANQRLSFSEDENQYL